MKLYTLLKTIFFLIENYKKLDPYGYGYYNIFIYIYIYIYIYIFFLHDHINENIGIRDLFIVCF